MKSAFDIVLADIVLADIVLANGAAVDRVLQDSELRELWQESRDSDAWHSTMETLRRRLG